MAFTASVTLMVFSPDARRMSSCTAGRAVLHEHRGRDLLNRVLRVADVGHPQRNAVDGRDDDVVELLAGIDAAERAQPDLPLALLERPAGNLDVLLLNRVAHLVDRQAVRVQLLDVDDDVNFARPVAADGDGADAVDRLQRALDLLVGDLGQRAQARALPRDDQAHDRVGVGVLFLDDRRQDLGRHVPHRAGDLLAHRVRGVVQIAPEQELHGDAGVAAGVHVGAQLVDAGDAAERVLHRHDDRRGHLVGRRARAAGATR